MKRIAKIICKKRKLVLISSVILLIISFIGIALTKVNYDILIYLPEDIETVKGQNILTEEFNLGAYAVVVTDNLSSKEILDLEEKFESIEGVGKVFSIYNLLGDAIPIEMLPSEIRNKVNKDSSDLLFVTFKETTSSVNTIEAIKEMRTIASGRVKISGLSSMVLDTMEVSDKEVTIYVAVALILCLIVLIVFLDSYLVPFLLLINIGMAIIFNLGTNIIFGEISYITKAMVAVLQLGVTMDYSIFLYNAYEKNRESMKEEEAMFEAITKTFTSVLGSSLTTIFGFLVLCTMKLTLGKDLGLVMAKGVLLGVICSLIIFPSLLLVFDKWIIKLRHKKLRISFKRLTRWVTRHYTLVFTLFAILIIPMYLAYTKVSVYYKIDESLPKNLESIRANEEIKDKFNIVSPFIILIDSELKVDTVKEMIKEIQDTEGILFTLSLANLENKEAVENILDKDMLTFLESSNWQLILVSSEYDIATDSLSSQIDKINEIVKKYDKAAMIVGEGPLMKDMVSISDEDFKKVNTSSIICILVIMIIVLKSFWLPLLLILGILFAIFTNMGLAYFGGDVLPFIAPIVLGTIQLGATIDYAILYTNNYLERRKRKISKKDSALEAGDATNGSIFVSGVCLFVATFGTAICSKLEMVGTICYLIARGALISVLVVIIILPSILLVFDKIIVRTEKKEKKKMRKKILGMLLCLGMLLLSERRVLAKEETVYAKLSSSGDVLDVTVTNHLVNINHEDILEDYSNLENIVNTSSSHSFEKVDNLLRWQANGSDIFYKGTIKKKLPVTEVVTYMLDGEVIDLDDLLGRSGRVEIIINFQNNEKHLTRGNTLYTPFVISTVMVLDGENNRDVKVNNGKVINNGKNYSLAVVSSPGLYESLKIDSLKDFDEVRVSFTTEKFELPSIYSVMTSLNIDENNLKVFDKFEDLNVKIDELLKGSEAIESGAGEVLMGSQKLSGGSSLIKDNMVVIQEKLHEINMGSSKISAGLREILLKLEEVQSTIFSSENDDRTALVESLIENNEKTVLELESKNKTLNSLYLDYNLGSFSYEEILSLDLDNKMDLYNIKYTYENIYESNELLGALLKNNNLVLRESLDSMSTLKESISSLIMTLKSYLNDIYNGSNSLEEGVSLIESGNKLINDKMSELVSGTYELEKGVTTLNDGIKKFNEEGMEVIDEKMKRASYISDKVKDLMKLGTEYKTFDLGSHAEDSTKFIMVIDGVKKEEEKAVEENIKVKVSLLERIKNLFK